MDTPRLALDFNPARMLSADQAETSLITDGYLLLGDFDPQTLSSQSLDAERLDVIQTLRLEYATNPELFTDGEPLYAFDLTNQVFLENPNPEAVPEPGVAIGVVLVGLIGGYAGLKPFTGLISVLRS